MSGQFFRAPGATVSYTPRQTRNYVSRKVRLSRGLNMPPTRRDRTKEGWRFWFQSPRGPAKDGGNWKVEVVRVDSDSEYPPATRSPGQISWPNGSSATFTGELGPSRFVEYRVFRARYVIPYDAQWVYVTQSYNSMVAEHGAENVKQDNRDPFVCYVRYTSLFPNLAGQDYVRNILVDRWSGGSYELDTLEVGGGTGLVRYQYFYHYVAPSTVACSPLVGQMTVGFTRSVESGDTLLPQEIPTTGSTSGNFWFYTSFNEDGTPACIIKGPSGDDYPPPTGGGSGPGAGPGEPPPGFLGGAGPWAYACNCPDYTGHEPAYNVPLAPSHRKDRSFTLARPLSPCKHIASSAQAVGDQKTIAKWNRQFKWDATGREYTEGPKTTRDYSYGRQQRDMEYAFRKTQIAARKALGKERAEARARRAARRLSDRLGRMNRWNTDSDFMGRTINRIDSSKKVGRFGESLDVAYSPILRDLRSGDLRGRAIDASSDYYPTFLQRVEDDIRVAEILNPAEGRALRRERARQLGDISETTPINSVIQPSRLRENLVPKINIPRD